MALILSLQGCMAVGKTSAARYLEAHAPYLHISYEDNAGVMEEVRRRGLNKSVYSDYLEIQKLWIAKEVCRWEEAQACPCTVMDFGAEEIEFYTLRYPRTIGQNWEIEAPLEKELAALRRCLPQRILFLDASDQTLRQRKALDASRSREFFDHYLSALLPPKRSWFLSREDVDVLRTDSLSPEQVGQRVKDWTDRILLQQDKEKINHGYSLFRQP